MRIAKYRILGFGPPTRGRLAGNLSYTVQSPLLPCWILGRVPSRVPCDADSLHFLCGLCALPLSAFPPLALQECLVVVIVHVDVNCLTITTRFPLLGFLHWLVVGQGLASWGRSRRDCRRLWDTILLGRSLLGGIFLLQSDGSPSVLQNGSWDLVKTSRAGRSHDGG